MVSHLESGPCLAAAPLRLLLGSCETFRIVGLALSRSLSILILAFERVANLGESGRAR
jgi:hypothetical protein